MAHLNGRVPTSLANRFRRLSDALKPRDPAPPAKWCARNITMPSRATAIQGRWNLDAFPYCRAPVDAFNDPGVEEIVFMWGTQLGKTAMLIALLGYVARCNPGPAMLVGPNETSVRELMLTRIYPTFEESAQLSGLLLPDHLRNALLLDARDMLLFCAWSGSVTRLGEKAIRYLWATEVDKFSREATGEADSLALATERTKGFPQAKILYESTPSITGDSRIEMLYKRSDQRTYHVPCPHCGEYQELIPDQLKWPHEESGRSVKPEIARDATYYECAKCEQPIRDIHKPLMLTRGVWVRKGERLQPDGTLCGKSEASGRVVGFHLSSLYSPIVSFGKIAERWLQAYNSHKPKLIQNVINSWFAQTWSPPARKTAKHEVLNARGLDVGLAYDAGTCPVEPLGIIVTIDVQEDGLYYVVRAWSREGRSFGMRYGFVAEPHAFEKMNIENQHVYAWPGGEGRPAYVFVDTGFRTKDTYAACLHFGWNAVKGHDRASMSVVASRQQSHTGLRLWSVNSSIFKDRLYALIHETPLDGPGAWMVHRDTGLDYASQIVSEQRRMVQDRFGRQKYTWVLTGDKNHYLDCEVYQLAAAEILGFDLVDQAPPEPDGDGQAGGVLDPLVENYEPLAGVV